MKPNILQSQQGPVGQENADHLHTQPDLKTAFKSKLSFEAKNKTKPGILAQIFPFIKTAITEYSRSEPSYMTHELIVKALLGNPSSLHILELRSLEDESRADGWTPMQFAGNYIAFYGRNWSVGIPSHADGIERQEVGGKWAYRHSNPTVALIAGKESAKDEDHESLNLISIKNEPLNMDEDPIDGDWLKPLGKAWLRRHELLDMRRLGRSLQDCASAFKLTIEQIEYLIARAKAS